VCVTGVSVKPTPASLSREKAASRWKGAVLAGAVRDRGPVNRKSALHGLHDPGVQVRGVLGVTLGGQLGAVAREDPLTRGEKLGDGHRGTSSPSSGTPRAGSRMVIDPQ